MSETSSASKEQESGPGQRRGDVEICPVCGSGVHAQAYFCPRCTNYFCFVCRSRVSANDVLLQCVNRDCEYFGKLVCDQCDPAQTVADKPFQYKEPTDGYWPLWLLASVLVAGYATWRTDWVAGCLIFFGLYVGLGYLLQEAGLNIFGKERTVEFPRSSKTHSCVRCSQPAKLVSLPKNS